MWIDPQSEALFAPPERHTGRGRPMLYSEELIVTLATLGQVFHQKLRQTVGLINSILALAGITQQVPHWTTLGRRRKTVSIPLQAQPVDHPLVLLIDSTGIKVLGEGEWKVYRYGLMCYRQWRKLHLSIDAESLQILSAEVTESTTRDHQVVEALLSPIDVEIDSMIGDGAYDKRECYTALEQRDAWPVIPPWLRARIWRHGNASGPPHPRDVNLRYIRCHGRAAWYDFSGYHTRSLAETTMHRLKSIFGDRALTRSLPAQRAELLLRCRALNRMAQLGLPPVSNN